jgi:hypothetical protein
MKTIVTHLFSATLVAVLLLVVIDVIGSRVSGAASNTQPSVAQPDTYHISFDQAGVIALDHAPTAVIIGTPALTSYQGAVAYAVSMDTRVIYVEASTGRVLANIAALSTRGGDGRQAD